MCEDRIELRDVSAIPFRRLMDFMYNGKISVEYYILEFMRTVDPYKWNFLMHCCLPEKAQHIKNFWKNNCEMLELADRFDMKKSFQTYFHRKLADIACPHRDCFVCLTAYMFSLANDEYIGSLDKIYTTKLLKEWFVFAKEAEIDGEKIDFLKIKLFGEINNGERHKEIIRNLNGAILLGKVNIDITGEVATTLGASVVPTEFAILNGKQAGYFTGDHSDEELGNFIDKIIQGDTPATIP